MIKYANAQGTPILTVMDGDSWMLGNALVTVVVCFPEAPVTNDTSIMLRIDYGETSFIFTGDAGKMTEYIAIDNSIPIHADVLKVGHHGSSSSSSAEFLAGVSPKYAVISCGRKNAYGHPSQEVLDKLKYFETIVYRTDLQGTIICNSDGSNIIWQTEHNTDADVYQSPSVIIN